MIRGRKEISVSSQGAKTHLIITLGIFIGFLTGLVGAGGGFLIIPALVLLAQLPMKVAIGTSLFIIGFNSLLGFLGDVLNSTIDWKFLFVFTGLAIAGIFLGNWLATKIQGHHLRKSFGWFTLVIGCWILIKELLIF